MSDDHEAAGEASGLVVGVGFSSAATALEIASLVTACLGGRRATLLALPDTRAELAAGREAASMLDLPLRAVGTDAIEAVQGRCLTRPCRAARAVAEGAALAAAGPAARLLGPRAKHARVTCALAAVGGADA